MQEEDTISADAREQEDLEEKIDTVVITALRRPAEIFEIPRALNLVPKSTIRRRPILSVADAAQDQIGVWIEKRTASIQWHASETDSERTTATDHAEATPEG